MKKAITTVLLAVLLLTVLCIPLTSCSSESLFSEGDGELQILCTTFAPFDIAREVGGNRVTVTLLQDSGADLHNYTPTAATLDALSKADVFIYIGGSSDESWLPDAIRAAGNEDLVTLCLMDFVEPVYAELENDWTAHSHSEEVEDEHEDHSDHDNHDHDQNHEGHDHGADEHIWTSVRNAAIMTEEISHLLASVDPEGAAVYSERADAYIEKLSELDSQLEEIFKDKNMLIVADRFPFVYLLHDYHVPYKAAFSGCSTEINSGFETQIDLIKAVRASDSDFIITTEGGDKHLAEAISAETGCRIISLDSMQSVKRADIESGVTYLSVMEKNIETLKEAYKWH